VMPEGATPTTGRMGTIRPASRNVSFVAAKVGTAGVVPPEKKGKPMTTPRKMRVLPMQELVVSLACALVLSTTVLAHGAQLVGWWPFEGSADDVTGHFGATTLAESWVSYGQLTVSAAASSYARTGAYGADSRGEDAGHLGLPRQPHR
jgi:hypothetical protein